MNPRDQQINFAYDFVPALHAHEMVNSSFPARTYSGAEARLQTARSGKFWLIDFKWEVSMSFGSIRL